jgi:hypothetical protein
MRDEPGTASTAYHSALDHPRGGQIMFRDAGGGSIELSTMGDREERLPVGLSILLMLGLTALAGRFWFSLRLCSGPPCSSAPTVACRARFVSF